MSSINSTLRSRALALTALMLADNVTVAKVAAANNTALKPYFLNEYTTQEVTDGLTGYAESITANHDVVDVATSELQDAITGSGRGPLSNGIALLLPFTGADGATVATDVSNYGHTVTLGTGAAITKSINDPFGNNVGVMNIGDGIAIPYSGDSFGVGDFTVEGWVYVTNDSYYGRLFTMGFPNLGLYVLGASLSGLALDGSFSGGSWSDGLTALTKNTWVYVKLYRLGTTMNVQVNDTVVYSGYVSAITEFNTRTMGSTDTVYIGGDPGWPVHGKLSNWRITQGTGIVGAKPGAAFW